MRYDLYTLLSGFFLASKASLFHALSCGPDPPMSRGEFLFGEEFFADAVNVVRKSIVKIAPTRS